MFDSDKLEKLVLLKAPDINHSHNRKDYVSDPNDPDADIKQLAQQRMDDKSRFGLMTFDEDVKVLSSIEMGKTKAEFEMLRRQIKTGKSKTMVGRALDYTRLKQFL